MEWLYNLFWTESIWLPVGYTWKDLESTPERQKSDLKDLYYTPVWVFLILLSRYAFEELIATPLCNKLGIRASVTSKDVAAKKESSFRRKKELHAQLALKKATETCWRFVFYFCMLSYGSYVLFRKDWFLDNSKWIKDFIETHEFSWDMKCYYIVELSLYISLLISQFFDIKRKDFYQLFVHHVTTVALLLISYIESTYRFGLVILYLHDMADVWLEAAKLANYAKTQKLCDILFAIFAVVFFFTRLVYFPVYVAYGYFYYNTYHHGIIHKTLVTLCYVLLLLHCYWGWLIGKMAYNLIVVGKVEKDTRSESESED